MRLLAYFDKAILETIRFKSTRVAAVYLGQLRVYLVSSQICDAVIVTMDERRNRIVESARTTPPKRPVQMAVVISFWTTFSLFIAAYIGLAFYSNMPLPLRLVTGTSMEPTLRAGDIIMLKALPFSRIRKGDLVAYKSPDAANARAEGRPDTILHRVVDVDEDGRVLTMKGDNSRVDPWPVTPDKVQGKQVLRIPAVGRPILLLTNTKGAVFFSGLVLVSSLMASTLLVYSAIPLKIPKLPRKDKSQLR